MMTMKASSTLIDVSFQSLAEHCNSLFQDKYF